jgi:hypothetical protein
VGSAAIAEVHFTIAREIFIFGVSSATALLFYLLVHLIKSWVASTFYGILQLDDEQTAVISPMLPLLLLLLGAQQECCSRLNVSDVGSDLQQRRA